MATANSLAELLANTVVDRMAPLRDQIYQIIRGAIVTGRVKPGDSIDEVGIARLSGYLSNAGAGSGQENQR